MDDDWTAGLAPLLDDGAAAAGIVVWANMPTETTAVARTNHALRLTEVPDPVLPNNLLIGVNAASSELNMLI